MDLLILLTYSAIAIAAFRVFKLPVNGYTVTTAALGGLGLLSLILLLMNYNHPYTHVARFYYHTTPIVSEVRGKVVEVAVTDSQRVKAGDVLFRIDPTPFQAQVDLKKARLAAAKQSVAELQVALASNDEAYKAAVALRDAAKDTFERNQDARDAISESEFVQSRQSYLAAVSQASQANAERELARLETESKIGDVHTTVAEAEAELDTAQFNLDQTVVRAPTDGVVRQVMLRPGMMAVPLPLKPVMVFHHDESRFFVASFLQNNAQRIEDGAEAEAIFPSVPGRVFRGTVRMTGSAVAQGQLQPSGDMIVAENIVGDGRINVVIDFDESAFDGFQIVPGSSAKVAVYSNHFHAMAIIRRVLLRMKSWTHFVFSDGHDLSFGH